MVLYIGCILRRLAQASGLVVLMLWAGLLAMLLLAAPMAHASTTAAYLDVSKRGIHRVSFAQLRDAGIDFSGVPASELALEFNGDAQPLYVFDESGKPVSQGAFSSGHTVEFLADRDQTQYRSRAVYLLHHDAQRAEQVAVEITAPDLHFAKVANRVNRWAPDRLHSRISPVDDPWFARRLTAYRKAEVARIGFELPDAAVGRRDPATLRAVVWGANDSRTRHPDHRVEVWVNDIRVATRMFDGVTSREILASIRPGVLMRGRNVVELRSSNGGGSALSVVAIESVELEYTARLQLIDGRASVVGGRMGYLLGGLIDRDISVWRINGDSWVRVRPIIERMVLDNGLRENGRRAFWLARIAGARGAGVRHEIASSAAIATPAIRVAPGVDDLESGEADYLVVVHADLTGASLNHLVAERRSEGRQVKVVDVASIYRRWSSGNVSANAIRQYISWASANLGVRQVLLVGGDTFDYRNRLRGSRRGTARSLIPTLYAPASGRMRHEPADPLFGDVDGDGMPEIAIGRLPVQTEEELALMVEKTLGFASVVDPQAALFVSAATSPGEDYSFSQQAQLLAQTIPDYWNSTVLSLDEQSPESLGQQFAMHLASGVALTTWIGPASAQGWGSSDELSAGSLQAAADGGLPTVVNQIGCCSAWIVDPRRQSLAHQWLIGRASGAAAVFGTGARVDRAVEEALSRELIIALVDDGLTVGDALLQAKRALVGQFDATLLRQAASAYLLLGDPGMRLPATFR